MCLSSPVHCSIRVVGNVMIFNEVKTAEFEQVDTPSGSAVAHHIVGICTRITGIREAVCTRMIKSHVMAHFMDEHISDKTGNLDVPHGINRPEIGAGCIHQDNRQKRAERDPQGAEACGCGNHQEVTVCTVAASAFIKTRFLQKGEVFDEFACYYVIVQWAKSNAKKNLKQGLPRACIRGSPWKRAELNRFYNIVYPAKGTCCGAVSAGSPGATGSTLELKWK